MANLTASSGEVARPSRYVHPASTSRWSDNARIVIPALAIAGAIIVGMGWGITPLTVVGASAAIIVAIVAPAIGLATIALMGSLQPPLVIPAPGFNAILVAALALGCVYRLPIDRPQIRVAMPMLLVIGFVLYVGVQQSPQMIAGYVGDLGYLVYSNSRELVTGFGLVLAAGFVLARRQPLPFIALGLASAVLSASIAILTFANLAGGAPIAGLLAHTTLTDRAVGTFGNPNYFGVFAAVAAVTAFGWMMGTQSTRIRFLLLVAAIPLSGALAVSLSRGAMIAFAVGLACLVFSRVRLQTAALIAAGLLVAATVLFPTFIEWRLSITNGSSSDTAFALLAQSDHGRLAAVLAGPSLFMTSPLFGIGWGHYASMSSQFAGPGIALGAHNWYVSVLAELGIVGIVIWILLLLALVMALRSRPTFARSMGFGVLATYAVGSMFLEAPTSFQTSAFAILIVVAAITSDWPTPLGANRPPTNDGEV